jgi:hypothetical protein
MMAASVVDFKIRWLKMMSVPESRTAVGRAEGINGRDKFRLDLTPSLERDEGYRF